MKYLGSGHRQVSAAVWCCVHLLVAVALSLLSITAQAQSEPLEIYRQAMQAMLDQNILPSIKETLTQTERSQLAGFRIEVTGSNDPQKMQSPSSQKTGGISAGFMSLQDVLIEAALIEAMDPHGDDLFEYALDVTRYGLSINRFSKAEMPKPFWLRIGWPQSKYQQLRTTLVYSTIRYRGTQQSLAWLVAVMMSERLMAATAIPRDAKEALSGRLKVYENAATLMMRSDLVPAPPWPIAMLYAANRSKLSAELSADVWMCEARQILDVSVAAVKRSESRTLMVEQREQQRMSVDWNKISIKLGASGHCASSD